MLNSCKRVRKHFVIHAIVKMHHPHRPPLSAATHKNGEWWKTSSNAQWSCRHGQKRWNPGMTFKSTTLRGFWWLRWWITLCTLLSLWRFTSFTFSEMFPNCLLSVKHPAKLANADSLIVIQTVCVQVVKTREECGISSKLKTLQLKFYFMHFPIVSKFAIVQRQLIQ